MKRPITKLLNPIYCFNSKEKENKTRYSSLKNSVCLTPESPVTAAYFEFSNFINFKKRLIIFSLFIVFIFPAMAQTDEEPKDSVIQKEWGFKSVEQLADTAWWALQQKTSSEFISLIPTLAILKETFDSLEIKNNPQVIRIKYNFIFFKVTKQLKIINAKAKANNIKLKSCAKDKVKIRTGQDEKGNVFAYITLECHKAKREFTIKFVALQLNTNWYIVDELKLEFAEDNPYFKPPIKVKKK